MGLNTAISSQRGRKVRPPSIGLFEFVFLPGWLPNKKMGKLAALPGFIALIAQHAGTCQKNSSIPGSEVKPPPLQKIKNKHGLMV